MENNIPVMLKIKEVPERFKGTTEFMIRQLVITGTLPAVKIGRKYLICEAVLCEYLTWGNNQANQPENNKIRKQY